MLVASNFLGQNTAAIAATEAQYGQMWAQDAAAMYGYAASSAVATRLSLFNTPREVANPNAPATEETTTYKLAVGSFSSSALSLSTDVIRIDEASLKSWAETIIRESSQPVLRLESVRIVLERLPIEVAEGLIGIGTRDAAVIDIPDVPADLVNTVIMTAGTVTLDGRELQLRDVILTPGTVFGIRPLATSDLPGIVTTPPNFTTYPTSRPLAVNDLNVYAVANYLAVV